MLQLSNFKKTIFTIIVFSFWANVSAQIKLPQNGNVGIGTDATADTKLRLDYNQTTSGSLSGLYSTTTNSNVNSTANLYGIKSRVTSASVQPFVIGVESVVLGAGNLRGLYSSVSGTGDLLGVYAKVSNTDITTTSGAAGEFVDVYSLNKGNTYGHIIDVNNDNTTSTATIYGVKLVTNSKSGNSAVYGVYSTVSGGDAIKRYAGFFTGGKLVSNTEFWAWNATSNAWWICSDERLKTEIKPLSDEKDKLYLLQGKSYKKKLRSMALEEDSLAINMEIVEMPEYGYLAQELEEVFPILVSQDSEGYYSVNYIALIPVIIEALKDQRLAIEKQQEQIERQQLLIEKLQNSVFPAELRSESSAPAASSIAPIEPGLIAQLYQNAPNPFSVNTEIRYFLSAGIANANLYIYDMQGKQIKNIPVMERGEGAVQIQGSELNAGMYIYTLIADNKVVDTKRMILTE